MYEEEHLHIKVTILEDYKSVFKDLGIPMILPQRGLVSHKGSGGSDIDDRL